ncbi:caspase family protein [Nocardia takedensis]|uniref:caspase family protein n=1 Tax=Nocardia takedensis TaxID=259390 RepID=UPI003F758921
MSRIPHRDSSRAVLVGVGRYDLLHDIPSAANNVLDLHRLLTSPGAVLSTQHCRTLRDPAGTQQIGDEVERAAEEASDTLLVYFTGHGVLDSRGRLYLALTNTDPDRIRWTALPFATVREAIAESSARTRILILDCCFSGRAFDALSTGPDAVLGQAEIEGTYTITSSSRNEPSFAPPGHRHTAFTAALIAAASTPDLSLDDLYNRTRRHLRERGHPDPQRRAVNTAGRLVLFPRLLGPPMPVSNPPEFPWPTAAAPQPVDILPFGAHTTYSSDSSRAEKVRKAILTWLNEEKKAGRGAPRGGVQALLATGNWIDEPITEREFADATVLLKKSGMIDGTATWGGAVVAPTITAEGEAAVTPPARQIRPPNRSRANQKRRR